MRTKVTADGLLIPKRLLEGVEEVEIRQEQGILVIVPVTDPDPLLTWGTEPIDLEIADAAVRHDDYLYHP
jgi:virulence-associated protein VagC